MVFTGASLVSFNSKNCYKSPYVINDHASIQKSMNKVAESPDKPKQKQLGHSNRANTKSTNHVVG